MSGEGDNKPGDKPGEKPADKAGDKNENYVPASAYESLQSKSQTLEQQNKDMLARLTQMEADNKAKETAELENKEEFKTLYEKEKADKEAALGRLDQNDKLYKDTIKKSHLRDALGGKVKDQYLNFADIDKIELDAQGNPTADSLKVVSEKFREDHAALIPTSSESDISKVPAGTGPGSQKEIKVDDLMSDRYAFHEMMKGMLNKK